MVTREIRPDPYFLLVSCPNRFFPIFLRLFSLYQNQLDKAAYEKKIKKVNVSRSLKCAHSVGERAVRSIIFIQQFQY
jgi:hypothetical protein